MKVFAIELNWQGASLSLAINCEIGALSLTSSCV
jgi:hypothetical protein